MGKEAPVTLPSPPEDAAQGVEAFKLQMGLIAQAGAGSLEAQRSLRDLALETFADGRADLGTASFWALVMARLAASHGERVDRMALASSLCVNAMHMKELGEFERADELVGEAFAIIDALADGGDAIAEHAAEYIQAHSDYVRPEVLKRASKLRGFV